MLVDRINLFDNISSPSWAIANGHHVPLMEWQMLCTVHSSHNRVSSRCRHCEPRTSACASTNCACRRLPGVEWVTAAQEAEHERFRIGAPVTHSRGVQKPVACVHHVARAVTEHSKLTEHVNQKPVGCCKAKYDFYNNSCNA